MLFEKELEERFSRLIEKLKEEIDEAAVRKAFEFAAAAHKNQYRLSGEPYIFHCLEVADIVSDYIRDTPTIQAAILHDTCRDANVPISDIEKEFGKRTADLVDSLTKIGKIPFLKLEQAEVENIRKMLLALSKDVRIILIKLADRLHNMRTIKYLPEDKQKMMAEETIQIYVPIAHKLNITKIKNELEDLYLSVTDPAAYNEIRKALEEKKKEKYEEIENIRKEIETLIRSKGIDATVKSREKHIYSIYKKMKRKELTFEQLMDLFAIRIITKRVSDCYKVLDIISENYSIIPGTLDDYIVTPKSNMYQSIHVNFLTKKGQNIEAQIRTEEMDIIAERGIAAHWKYKGYKEESYDKKIEWMKNLLNWQREIKEQKEYIDGIRIELFERGVIVFTPKGDMLELPHGATALDFAFALHTSLGLNADKIKVNGKIVSFDHQLADGDIVEVIPAPAPKVNVNWLKFVKTSKAKAKIRAALNITGPKKPLKIKEEKIEQMKGEKAKIQNGVLIVDINSPNIRLAKCCNPTINDEIISYPPKEGKYTIHRRDCQIFRNTPEYKKRIEAKWKEIEGIYLQKINIVGEDRPKLLSNIIKTILQIGLKIQKINIDTRNEKIIINIILLYKKKEEIKNVKKSLKNIEGVKEVYTII